MDPIEYKKAFSWAIKKLARRSYHSEELRALLQEELFAAEVVEAVLIECSKKRFIHDQEWVSRFFEKGIQKGKSFIALSYELQRRGIPRDGMGQGQYNSLALQSIVAKKYPFLLEEKKDTRAKKAILSLIRRGFSYEEITGSIRLNGMGHEDVQKME